MAIQLGTIDTLERAIQALQATKYSAASAQKVRDLLFQISLQDGQNGHDIINRLVPSSSRISAWQAGTIECLPEMLRAHLSWVSVAVWAKIDLERRKGRYEIKEQLLDDLSL